MIRIVLAALAALFISSASAQVNNSANGMVPNTAINLAGLGAGVWSAYIATPGTGYVPGDTYVPVISGAVTNSIVGGAYNAASLVVASTQVVSATVAAGGASCSGATATLTGTTGNGGTSGAYFTATVPIVANAISGTVTITSGGTYQTNPTSLVAEPVTGSSCVGAQLNVVMGAKYANVQSPGSYSYVPGNSQVVTQSSTSGAGTGATWTITFAAQAAYLLPGPNSNNGTAGSQAAYNYCAGYNCLSANTTGVENTAFGWNALASVTTGGFNTAFGVNALGSAMTTGSNNSGFGVDAGRNVTSGIQNVFVGQSAGITTTTGGQNTFVGDDSGHFNTTGSNNVALGYQAMHGLNGTSTGSFNTAIGRQAGFNVSSGTQNTFLGMGSGAAVTTTSGNIFIGSGVGPTNATGASNIIIGSGTALVCDAPSAGINGFFGICATTGSTYLMQGTLTAGSLSLTLGGSLLLPAITTDATHTDSTICQDTTTHQLYFGSGTLGICLGTSSARFKHAIEPLAAGLDQIMKLEPVSYKLNADHGDPDKTLYGFTAEQGARVLPELTGPDADGKPNTFDYLGVVPVLVKGMQQLKAENDNLRACNDNWKCRLFGIGR